MAEAEATKKKIGIPSSGMPIDIGLM